MEQKKIAIQQLLQCIEQEMLLIDLWQCQAPEPDAFLSIEPFAVDTMSANEWLQWIFLPRMQALFDANASIPNHFSLYPYFEEALKGQKEALTLLSLIEDLDALVKQ